MDILRIVPMDREARRRFVLWRGRRPDRPWSVMDGTATQNRRFPLNESLAAALAFSGRCGPPPDARDARGAPAKAFSLSAQNRGRGPAPRSGPL